MYCQRVVSNRVSCVIVCRFGLRCVALRRVELFTSTFSRHYHTRACAHLRRKQLLEVGL